MSRRQRRAQMERRRRAAVSARSMAAAGGLAVVATLLSGSVAEADGSFTVTNLNPTGSGSLAGEISAANAYGAANSGASSTITFTSTLSGSIDLTAELPTITEPVEIYGPGAAQVTVTGTGSNGIVRINGGASTEISGLTLTGGSYQYGGAIDAIGSLTLLGDVVTGNAGGYGGAIYAYDGLIVDGSTISGNTSRYGGGGIDSLGELSVKYSTIANNTGQYGGGIYQARGGLAIEDSTISGNKAVAVSGNTYGGGILIGRTSTTPVLDDSIVSGNTATVGPDVYTSTLSGHPTPTAAFSLIGSLSGSGITPDGSDLVGVNPLLGPLQLNGGTGETPTMAPAFNSPVIDQGYSEGFTSDQRGLTRPVDLPGYPNAVGGDGSDMGAVELQAGEVVPVVSGLSPASGMAGSTLVISGARISTATQVLFGSTPAGFVANASGQLVAAVPAGSGTVDVRVVTPGGESGVVAGDQFTYTLPPPPPPATQVAKASFGNQAITLTTPSLSACTASTGKLSATLTSVAGSHGTKLRFSNAGFFLDRGVKHVRKKTEHLKHGKTKRITVTTYTANVVVHHVPVTVSLKLTGLKSGSHTLKVVVSYKKTVTKHHHKRTVTVTKTIKSTFKVC